jgi:nucleoside-diphosphate-sugar epimerase
MKLLILGGSGFFGDNFLKSIFDKKDDIYVLSRTYIKNRNIKFIKCDLNNIKLFNKIIQKLKPNICLDLSWSGIPDYSIKNNNYNFIMKKKIYSCLVKNYCKKIISIGSCWEYGDFSGKASEKLKCQNLIHFARVKIKILNFLKFLKKKYNLCYIWARVFYVYGPGNKKNSLIPSIVRNLKRNKMLILNRPDVANDFIYISDVTKALYELTFKKIKSGIYNLGSGKLFLNKEIYDKILFIIKKKNCQNKIKFNRYGLYADISKIMSETKWRPVVSINEGIKKTIS